MDEPQVRLIVQITARLSAIAFLAALGLFAARLGSRPRKVDGAIALLTAFLVLHTIHFGAVGWLAILTASENIRERGGWALMMGVAAAFYLAAFGILRLWRSVASARRVSRPQGLAAHGGVLFIAAIFLNSYAARAETKPIYWLWIVGLVLVVTAYMARARPLPGRSELSGADDHRMHG